MCAESIPAFGDELDALRARLEELRRDPPRGPTAEALLLDLETAHEQLRVADEEVRAQAEEVDRLLDLQRAERWMHERVMAALPVAVVVTDTQGSIETANSSATALLHVTVDHLLRKPLFAFVATEHRPELRRHLAEAVGSMRDFRSVATLRPRDGAPVRAEVAATPGRDRGAGKVEVTWVLLTSPGPAGSSDDGLRESSLTTALVELTQLPVSSTHTSKILTRVAQICESAFRGQASASLIIGDPSAPTLVTTGSEFAQGVDGAQMISGEGPCRAAWESATPVSSPELPDDDRWPRLGDQLESSPVRSALAVPVAVGDRTVGILNLYSRDDLLCDRSALADAELLGRTIAAVMHEIDLKAELETTADQLRTALQSRATIDQAKGMIMALRRCGPDEAFEYLAHLSSTANVKLRDLAERMVGNASQGIENIPDQR